LLEEEEVEEEEDWVPEEKAVETNSAQMLTIGKDRQFWWA